MKLLISVAVAAIFICGGTAVVQNKHNKVVCYWNSTSFERTGSGKFKIDDLAPALPFCTHLIYGFAGIDAKTFKAIPLHPNLDTGAGYGFYKLSTQLKKNYPKLKIYLGIGGNADLPDDAHKYLVLVEKKKIRETFITSVIQLLGDYKFDGIDLAWQFPADKVIQNRGAASSMWNGVKNLFGSGEFKDKKQTEHREGFTSLVKDLKDQLKLRNKALTITVLPNVNASTYYDLRLLHRNIDAVHLMTFDQKTPERNPKEADYTNPIYKSYDRNPEDNIDSAVKYWVRHGTPSEKIVVVIPAFGRTWKLTSDSQIYGIPPIVTKGPGAPGPHTSIPGFLSFGEICARLTESSLGSIRRVEDPTKANGVYAYKSYDKKTKEGIWIGYEDPVTAGNIASYAKKSGLGGIAIFDLSTDDFRGTCNGKKFPIVRAAKSRL